MNNVSKNDIAHLRFRAFEMLDSFSFTKEGSVTKFNRSLTWDERKKWADELVKWAISDLEEQK